MTSEKILSELRKQLSEIQSAISIIENMLKADKAVNKGISILKGLKKRKSYNGTHWMQQPKNKAKMLKAVSKMQRANKRVQNK